MSEWRPIETAPLDKRVLLWWTPIDGNKYAEVAIIGEVSSHEPGKYWDGMHSGGADNWRSGYKELARITHWMPLPQHPPGMGWDHPQGPEA